MRHPRSKNRSFLTPVFIGAQLLFLAGCEPVQTLQVQQPTFAPGRASADLIGGTTASIAMTATDSTLVHGQQVQATATPRRSDGSASGATVSWAVSPSNVATISASGLLTAGQTSGSATVSATADGITRTMTITVSPGTLATMMSISANPTTIKIGQTTQVSGLVMYPSGKQISGSRIVWSISPSSVASVSSTGLVKGVSVGTSTVTAKADTVTRRLTITVIDSATTTPGTTPTTPTTPDTTTATPAPAPTTPVPTGPTGGSYGPATAAELPRSTVQTNYPSMSRQVRVPAGANLQTAINNAQYGDELLLAPGATYTGNFTLPAKSGSGWIVIRTDLSDAVIGAPGTRMTPSRAGSARLAKILTPNIYSTITTDIGAHHYRLTGVEIGANPLSGDINAIVRFGEASSAQNTIASIAHNLILDRSYVHVSPTSWVRRCVMLNSATSAIIDSWLSECHSNSGDSQAIVGWNGPGPFLIQNNHLEAGHEVILFGGSGTSIQNLSPSDVTIRGNHIMRPASWKGVWQVKNLIETKHVRRMLIEGNVVENTWASGQTGYAFVLKSENQNNDASWSQSTDVTIRYNKIRNVGGVFNIAATSGSAPAVPAARFVISDNVIENVNVGSFMGDGRTFLFQGGIADVVTMHNTIVSAVGGTAASITFATLPTMARLVVHSNVLHHGAYGIKGASYGMGSASINQYAPGALVTNNVIAEGGNASSYPANNYFTSLSSVGFANLGGGDYHLSGGSSYQGKGYDGRNIGADIDQVNALTGNAVVGP
jgi:hypothetical protein